MNVDFSKYFIPANSLVIEKLKDINIDVDECGTISLFDIMTYLHQTYGLLVTVKAENINDGIDNPYFYELHYVNHDGIFPLTTSDALDDVCGFYSYADALTHGIIAIINIGLRLKFI